MSVMDAPAADAPPAAESVVGRVETLDFELGLVGWAYRPDAPEQPLEVELWAGGVRIASALTDRYRADLGSEANTDLNPGFLFSPAALKLVATELSLDSKRLWKW